jgi:flagellar basal body-associated protein FliL
MRNRACSSAVLDGKTKGDPVSILWIILIIVLVLLLLGFFSRGRW